MVNSEELYNHIYQKNPRKWALPHRDEFAFIVLSRHVTAPDTFLDIGCGNGHTIQYFKERWPDTKYYGIDLSSEAIKIARQCVPDATFYHGVFEETELPYCDVVTVMGVAEHFVDLPKSLALLGNVGKTIYIECPNCLAMSHNPHEGFRELQSGSGQTEWHLGRRTWERYLEEAGWHILESITGLTITTEFVWVIQ